MELLVGFLCASAAAIVCGWIWVWRAAVARKRAQEQRHAEYLIAAVRQMARWKQGEAVAGQTTRPRIAGVGPIAALAD